MATNEIKCEKCFHKSVCEKKTCAECQGSYCDKCELYDLYNGVPYIENCENFIDADLINRKEELIESLIAGQETLQKALAKKNAEIEYLRKEYVPMLERNLKETDKLGMEYMLENARLLKENQILSTNADTAFQDGLNEAQDLYAEQIRKEIKAQAIKEFAEKYKTEINERYEDIAYKDLFFGVIDYIVKEMMGE